MKTLMESEPDVFSEQEVLKEAASFPAASKSEMLFAYGQPLHGE